jgi:hypothetical protein
MANNLGSLSPFELAPEQPAAVGMRHAGTLIPVEDPSRPPLKVGAPSPEEAAEMQRPRPAQPALSIPELLADCEKALANFEKHHERRDCAQLEAQIRSELLSPLLGFHVQAEIKRASEKLATLYDPRWSAKAYLRDGAYRFKTVGEARKCYGRLQAAKTPADFLVVAKELLEFCKLSLSEPGLLRTEEG